MKHPPSGREPDVLVIAAAHRDRVKAMYLDGPADLALEIVSRESVDRDYQVKLGEYQAAGVLEYWLIDPLTATATFYQLDAKGWYQAAPPDADDVHHSRILPGYWLRVGWLWQVPLPDPTRALCAIDREACARSLQAQAEQPDLE
jgi:Uma2 family endonuclease